MKACIGLLALLFAGCGHPSWLDFGPKEDKPERKASVQMTGTSANQEPTNFGFTDADTCNLDVESGILEVDFQESNHRLRVEIRDFIGAPKKYRCQQAYNNNESSESLGDLYETCMIDISTKSEDADGFDAYSMHRNAVSIKEFEYPNEHCVIEVTNAQGQIAAYFSCKDMAQTAYRSRPRNPVALDGVHADVTADFSGEFACKPKQARSSSRVIPPATALQKAIVSLEIADQPKVKRTSIDEDVSCVLDEETGLLSASFSDGQNHLEFAIRDFSAEEGSYKCIQAENNKDDNDSVGDLYETCMVEFDLKNASHDSADSYSMHRKEVSIKRFSYGGSCIIDFDNSGSKLAGSVFCEDMAQTKIDDAPKNPVATDQVNADIKAGLTAAFSCIKHRETQE